MILLPSNKNADSKESKALPQEERARHDDLLREEAS